MKASETHLQPLISRAEIQFIVPLFQRTYSWDKKEWQELWIDLLELYENEASQNHFIGSIVTIPVETVPQGVAKYLLIDGQQRLTTIFILLMLIRDNAQDERLTASIHEQQLINKFAKNPHEYCKLQPTQQDRQAFETLIRKKEFSSDVEQTQILKCYRFFERKIKQDVDLDKLSQTIINQLTIVSIVLNSDENPHLVFESLNARGKPLTQADLIRNYFFMLIHVDEQEEVFKCYWQPMQEALNENLTECIRHYLIALTGAFVRKNEIYITLKKRINENAVLESLDEIATYARYYEKIIIPSQEPSKLIQQALVRIKRIEVTVAYPFLLKCYYDYDKENLTEANFAKVIHYVENMVIRSSVCKLPSARLNKMFPVVYREAQQNYPKDFVKGVVIILQKNGYPNDEQFRQALINANFYSHSDGRERTKLILESIESSYRHKEPVELTKLTIEHVMPQKLTDWWKQHLGKEWQVEHELHLHTLGNLTLTGYNSELSNDSFPAKQKELAKSHLELNNYFASVSEWKSEQIKQRTEQLAELALNFWAYFGDTEQAVVPTTKIRHKTTGTKPSRIKLENQKLPVHSWRDVLITVLEFIAKEEPDVFEKIATEYPKFLSQDVDKFRRSAPLNNGYYMEVNLSAGNIYDFCCKAMTDIGLTTDDWHVEYK